jgi:hypothetical protein
MLLLRRQLIACNWCLLNKISAVSPLEKPEISKRDHAIYWADQQRANTSEASATKSGARLRLP